MTRKLPEKTFKIATYDEYQGYVEELKRSLDKMSDSISSKIKLIDQGNENSILLQVSEKLAFNSKHLDQAVFKILIMGEFKRGKSTLINAFLGKEILPAYTKPCTDVINEIGWGEKGCALIIKSSGAEISIPLEDLIHHVTIDGKLNKAEDKTEVARISWPLSLCEKGVEIIDTPGLNEHTSRTKVTHNYLPNADAIVFVLSADQACSLTELEVIENQLFQHGYTDIFFVVNRMNNVKEKERADVIDYIKQKIGKFTSDETTKIHFVDSLAALEAKQAGKDPHETFQSLESCIQEHLVDKRGQLRLTSISNETHFSLGYLEGHLNDRLDKINQDLTLNLQQIDDQLKSLSQSEVLKESVKARWKEGVVKIQEKIQSLYDLECKSPSFEVLMRRKLDAVCENRGIESLGDSAFITSEVNFAVESWISNWFVIRAKPEIEVLLRELMLSMSSEVYKTLSSFHGEKVQAIISNDPVSALFNGVSLKNVNFNNMGNLDLKAIPKGSKAEDKLSNATAGAILFTILDVLFTGGGASLLTTALLGAGSGLALSNKKEGDIVKAKEEVFLQIQKRFDSLKSKIFKEIASTSESVFNKFDDAFVKAVDLQIDLVKSGLEQKKRDSLLSKESKEALIENIIDLDKQIQTTFKAIEKYRKS